HRDHRHLHSFPTRRSSDLPQGVKVARRNTRRRSGPRSAGRRTNFPGRQSGSRSSRGWRTSAALSGHRAGPLTFSTLDYSENLTAYLENSFFVLPNVALIGGVCFGVQL